MTTRDDTIAGRDAAALAAADALTALPSPQPEPAPLDTLELVRAWFALPDDAARRDARAMLQAFGRIDDPAERRHARDMVLICAVMQGTEFAANLRSEGQAGPRPEEPEGKQDD